MPRRLLAALLALAPAAVGATEEEGPYAIAGFAGVQLDNAWIDIPKRPTEIEATEGRFLGVAASARLWRPATWFSVEAEAQVVRHVAGQAHWEVNAFPAARVTPWPGNAVVDASAAFGIGLSHTSEKPALELENEGETARTMIYWTFEIAAGPPDSPWEGLARIHHRSHGYGLFAEDGGYNGLVLGLRRRF